ncbi:DUF2798 domain-containing protein [Gorillibacterium sp. sgz5001074]|uniref:DUF2798 domain-containing protein n=1 Tax=Gorillibacterium sp. sgz5001074 TaxID=3446695 RepID=UPI003F6755EB
MGKNKKESFVFTTIMCFLMVLVMSFYNIALFGGFSDTFIRQFMTGFFPALAAALLLDLFVVGKAAKGLAHRLLRPSDPLIKKILLISFFMVCGMAACMSLFGTVAHYGFAPESLRHYPRTFGLNFIFALPLQFLVVGPVTRLLFTRIYPAPVKSAA